MKHFKLSIYTVLMFVVTWLLFIVARNPIFHFNIFDKAILNDHVNYQISGLMVAALALLILYIFADKLRLRYLNVNRNGIMKAFPLLGIKQEGKWERDGWSFGIIMAAVMGSVIFLQTYRLEYSFSLISILMAFPLAAANAFTEEVIFRISYVTMGITKPILHYTV